ncbi:hypothetical protein AQJ91_24220 [Streptomyces dysideae]|uniref:Uncharacterized protein n=1 Tax=Streptomyces dysideae TaxID=909626 RepID=A0A101UXA6_9ACTN|nr:hypothetical protein AQJ91_24220 [Streptomyces dysideae]
MRQQRIDEDAGAPARRVCPAAQFGRDLRQAGIARLDVYVEQGFVGLSVIPTPPDNTVEFGENIPDHNHLVGKEPATGTGRVEAGPDLQRRARGLVRLRESLANPAGMAPGTASDDCPSDQRQTAWTGNRVTSRARSARLRGGSSAPNRSYVQS